MITGIKRLPFGVYLPWSESRFYFSPHCSVSSAVPVYLLYESESLPVYGPPGDSLPVSVHTYPYQKTLLALLLSNIESSMCN